MHFLVFDRAPQSLDENVVHETTAAVHRNRDACSLEPAGEGGAGELRALIGVKCFRRAVPRQRFVERRDATARIHGVRQAPGQNRPAGPIDDRHQIQKAKIRYISGCHQPSPVRSVCAIASANMAMASPPAPCFASC